MAHTQSAKKRIVQSEKRRQHNTSKRSMIRTLIKKLYIVIATGDKNASKHAFSTVQSVIDRQASNKLIHKNKAARYKSKIMNKINTIIT